MTKPLKVGQTYEGKNIYGFYLTDNSSKIH